MACALHTHVTLSACVTVPEIGSQRGLGRFDTVEEAAQAYAKEYLRIHGATPNASQDAGRGAQYHRKKSRLGKPLAESTVDLSRWRSRNKAGFKGVRPSSGRYRSQIYIPGMCMSLEHLWYHAHGRVE